MANTIVDFASRVWKHLLNRGFDFFTAPELEHNVAWLVQKALDAATLVQESGWQWQTITLTLVTLVVVSILFALVFWRHRALYYNQFWGLARAVHQWNVFSTSSQPKYCNVCRRLISGFWIFRNTGWECQVCGRCAHHNCIADCEKFHCKTPCLHTPLRHVWVEGNLATDSVCAVCGIICSSSFALRGLRCLWCNRTIHEECKGQADEYCDLGRFWRIMLPPNAVRLAPSTSSSARMSGALESSSKYMEKMGTQLKESLKEVQEAMSTGLKEGIKEVSQGMKRINEAIRKRFKRKQKKGRIRDGNNQNVPTPPSGDSPLMPTAESGDSSPTSSTIRQRSQSIPSGMPSDDDPSRIARRPSSDAAALITDSTATGASRPRAATTNSTERGGGGKGGGRPSSVLKGTPSRPAEGSGAVGWFAQGKSGAPRERDKDRQREDHDVETTTGHSNSSGSPAWSTEEPREATSATQPHPAQQHRPPPVSISSGAGQPDQEQRGKGSSEPTTPSVPPSQTQQRAAGASEPVSASSSSVETKKKKQKMIELAKSLPAKANVWEIDASAVPPSVTPVLVFVNAKSGGQLGASLLSEFFRLLNPVQVVDIQAERGPQRALLQFKPLADANQLKIIVCGGDGTIGWVMDEMLKLYGNSPERHVPVAVLPLGTGNDLARVLGWGASFDGDIEKMLEKVLTSRLTVLDRWEVTAYDDKERELFSTTFNNYMDVGIAARVALKFHQLREGHPNLFQTRFGNKLIYAQVGFQDVFIDKLVDLRSVKIVCDGEEVIFPEAHLEGIILVNIPFFAGGVPMWRTTQSPTDTHGPPGPEHLTGMGRRSVSWSSGLAQAGGGEHGLAHTQHGSGADVMGGSRPSPFPNAPRASQQGWQNERGLHVRPSVVEEESDIDFDDYGDSDSVFQSHSRRATHLGNHHHQHPHHHPHTQTASHASDDAYDAMLTPPPTSVLSRCANRRTTDHHQEAHAAASPSPSPLPMTRETSDGLPNHNNHHPHTHHHHHHYIQEGDSHWFQGRRWRNQSMKDQVIEVVALRSLVHFSQCHVGMNDPVRVCQGRDIKIHIPREMAFQVDGEPRMVKAGVLHIKPKCESFMLSPAEPLSPSLQDSFKVVNQVLDWAVHESVISHGQRNTLLREFSRKM